MKRGLKIPSTKCKWQSPFYLFIYLLVLFQSPTVVSPRARAASVRRDSNRACCTAIVDRDKSFEHQHFQAGGLNHDEEPASRRPAAAGAIVAILTAATALAYPVYGTKVMGTPRRTLYPAPTALDYYSPRGPPRV